MAHTAYTKFWPAMGDLAGAPLTNMPWTTIVVILVAALTWRWTASAPTPRTGPARTLVVLGSGAIPFRRQKRGFAIRPAACQWTLSQPYWLTVAAYTLLLVLTMGAGGHTAEMLGLLRTLPPKRYRVCGAIIADSDTTSRSRAVASKVGRTDDACVMLIFVVSTALCLQGGE